jgi:2-dehydropantoate 2-reductase
MTRPERIVSIAIMGAGAIGSATGGMLARAGHRVTLVGREPHIREISNNGLHISGIWGEHTVTDLRAVTSPPDEYQDIVFLTVKSYDTDTAARDALHIIGPDTIVVSMQNGIGNVETLAGIVGKARTVGAMAIFGAAVPEPGSVEVTVIASETLVGEIDGRPTSRAMDIARMLDDAGIPTKPSVNIMREIWHKALYNIALNPLSAIFQVTYGQIADNPDTRWLISEMMSEAFLVAEAAGVDLGMDSPDEYLEILWNRKLPPTRDHRSSMLQDIVRGKRTEIDYINGKVVELGREYGIPTPYNNTIVKIVRTKEVIGAA